MKNQELNKYLKKLEELMPKFHNTITKMDSGCVEDMEITHHQFIALIHIDQIKNCTMSGLSQSLNVTMGNMTTMVDRLIKEGYVRREHNPEDRRIVEVALTTKGKNLVQKAKKIRQEMFINIIKKLTKQDIETMIKLLEKITNEGGKE